MKHRIAGVFLATCCMITLLLVSANAITGRGIFNNGLDGISINIYSSPYTDYSKVPEWGPNAYGPSGCAWFATSRAAQLTGKNFGTIYSGQKWYNEAYKKFGFTRGKVIKAKALACYSNHVSVVEKVSGNTVTISEGGYPKAENDYCAISHTTIAKLEAYDEKRGYFIGYVYFDYVPDNTRPTVTNASYTPISDGFRVDFDASDNFGVAEVRIAVWTDKNWQDDIKWSSAQGDNGHFSFNCYGRDHNNETGPYLVYIYAYDEAGNTSEEVRLTKIYIDKEKPIITNAKYTPIPGGFRIDCDASDNQGVTEVKFAMWTNKDWQDDIEWVTKSSGNGHYYCECYAKNHNGEEGPYGVYIYAFDASGNTSEEVRVTKIYIDTEKPTVTNATYKLIPGGFRIECDANDNEGVTEVKFAIWTNKDWQDDIKWVTKSSGNGHYYCNCYTENHNGEEGPYGVYIYAFDASGNTSEEVRVTKIMADNSMLASVKSHALSLTGDIGIIYNLYLAKEVLNDKGAKVVFYAPGESTSEVLVSKGVKKTDKYGLDYYGYTCEVHSSQMTGEVRAKVVLSNGTESEQFPYTVKEYADIIIANNNNNAEYTRVTPMVKAMLNYGGYAQKYFNYDPSAPLANKDLTAEEKDVSSVNVADLAKYASVKQGAAPEGISYKSATLILTSKTTIRYSFRLAKGHDISEFTFKNGNQVLTPYHLSDDVYCVEIPDVASSELDNMYTVTVGDFSVTYGALTYAYNKLKTETTETNPETLKNLLRALVLYNQEANEYFV